jgi:hypothetical protein
MVLESALIAVTVIGTVASAATTLLSFLWERRARSKTTLKDAEKRLRELRVELRSKEVSAEKIRELVEKIEGDLKTIQTQSQITDVGRPE